MTNDSDDIAELKAEIEDLRDQLTKAESISQSRYVRLAQYRDQNKILWTALETAVEQTTETKNQLEQAMRDLQQIELK